VTMCGKHMNKCTRRLSRLEQLSEALVLSRWVKNFDLPMQGIYFELGTQYRVSAYWSYCWFLSVGGSLCHIWIQLPWMGHGHAG
jgi:hypothetical protein